MDHLGPPGRNEPCLCGSGERFKNCCGKVGVNAQPPREIIIVKQFLSSAECQALVDVAKSSAAEEMGQYVEGSHRETVEYSQQRVGDLVNDIELHPQLLEVCTRAYKEQVSPRFNVQIQWMENPHILRYGPGGKYLPHADSESWNATEQRWKKIVDRDVSLLIYLDEDYTGGLLNFVRFNYAIKPSTGMLVFFPSDARYLHEAQALISGSRHVIVSWGAARGVDKVLAAPPDAAIPVT